MLKTIALPFLDVYTVLNRPPKLWSSDEENIQTSTVPLRSTTIAMEGWWFCYFRHRCFHLCNIMMKLVNHYVVTTILDCLLYKKGWLWCKKGWLWYKKGQLWYKKGQLWYKKGYGIRKADYGIRKADYGIRKADCGVRNADCGVRKADYGIRKADYSIGKVDI